MRTARHQEVSRRLFQGVKAVLEGFDIQSAGADAPVGPFLGRKKAREGRMVLPHPSRNGSCSTARKRRNPSSGAQQACISIVSCACGCLLCVRVCTYWTARSSRQKNDRSQTHHCYACLAASHSLYSKIIVSIAVSCFLLSSCAVLILPTKMVLELEDPIHPWIIGPLFRFTLRHRRQTVFSVVARTQVYPKRYLELPPPHHLLLIVADVSYLALLKRTLSRACR